MRTVRVFVGLDVGATNCRIRFEPEIGLYGYKTIPTAAPSYSVFRDRVIRAIKDMLSPGHVVASICLAMAGAVDNNTLIGSSNLEHLVNQPIQADFSKAFDNAPVELWNDCRAAGLAEFEAWGQPLGFFAPGTGIGVCLALSSKHIQGTELGHMVIDAYSELKCGDGCGGRGHLEAFAGGAGIEKRFGVKAEYLDPERWMAVLQLMAIGIRNVSLVMPLVVLGGSLMLGRVRACDELPLLQELVNELPATAPVPRLEFAKHGGDSGLVGAVMVAKQLAQVD